jgi:NitT/TauT family transport system ATP-binding protein
MIQYGESCSGMLMLNIKNFSVAFAGVGNEPVKILNEINLIVNVGEIVCIRGANGVGKTTLLNAVAGLLSPTTGEINYSGGDASIGYVQQDYTSSLLPWYNALENIAIPLRLKGVDKLTRQQLALKQLEELGFGGLPLDAFPHQLSGGQKQRIAIARALLAGPNMLLLDEPFANLDGRTVRELEEALLVAHTKRNLTIVLVSHDIDSSIYCSWWLTIHDSRQDFGLTAKASP